MANQTVTTVVNYDSAAISPLLNGESITINGGSVTVNADVRWNQQEAVFGNVTLSSTLGGSFLIDGTQVWEVPFSASSGNVPAQAALGSNGVTGGTSGATGELTRVWATGSLDPATAGAAMPATGFIKLRSKTGTFQNGETITLPGGATITASGAGKRSWIHVVGAAGSSINVSRLSTFSASGDWYELGVTNGADNQTLQYPVADGCPAIWIETSVGSDVYEIWLNGGPGVSSLWSTTDSRGKFFVCSTATGVITLAQRGGVNNGLRPAAGLRVRIPNVLMSSSSSVNWSANIGSTADPTTLYTFSASSSGALNLEYISSNWYIRATDSYGLSLTNSGVACGVTITNVKTEATLTNVGIGVYSTAPPYGLLMTGQFAGASLTDVFVTRYTFIPNSSCFEVVNGKNINLTRLRVVANCPFPFRANGVNTIYLTDFAGVRLNGNIFGSCTNVTITNPRVSHQLTGISTGISFGSSFDITNCADLFIDGFVGTFAADAPATNSVNGLYNLTGCARVEVRNIGTVATPLNMRFGGGVTTRNAVILVRCSDVVMRRIYVTPSSGSNAIDVNTDSRNVEFINVWSLTNSISVAAANMLARGSAVVAGSTMSFPATVGTHWGDTFNTSNVNAGVIQLAMNEPTTESASQVTATLDAAAGSGFNGSGSVLMKSATDELICTMPYYCLGVTGFANTAPTITATNSGNHTFEFQYNIGSGWNGTWLTLNGANLSAITVDPAVGVKLKFRITVATAASTNSLTSITLSTVTNATNRQIQYPLPTTQNIGSVINIRSGSRIRVYNVTTATEIANEVVPGTTWSYVYEEGTAFTDGDIINIRLARCSGATAIVGYEATAVAGTNGWALFAEQLDDDVYNANGVDGTTVTEFAFDYPNVQVDINDPDGTTTITRLYAWWANEQTTADGIRTLIGGLIAEDAANYKVISSIVDLKLDNAASTGVIFTGDIRLYRDDGAVPVVSSTTGGGSITLYAGKVYTVSVGASALTPAESAKLMSLPDSTTTATAVLSAAATTPIQADIRKVNNYTVDGEGSESNPWGPVA